MSESQDPLKLAPLITAILPGLVVGLVVSWSDGRQAGSEDMQKQLTTMAVQMTKMSQTLEMVCEQLKEKSAVDREQNQKLEELRLMIEQRR